MKLLSETKNKKKIMKNKIYIFKFMMILSLFFCFCRSNPPANIKIIEERDPVVKNIEEKDSIRKILPDTTQNNKP